MTNPSTDVSGFYKFTSGFVSPDGQFSELMERCISFPSFLVITQSAGKTWRRIEQSARCLAHSHILILYMPANNSSPSADSRLTWYCPRILKDPRCAWCIGTASIILYSSFRGTNQPPISHSSYFPQTLPLVPNFEMAGAVYRQLLRSDGEYSPTFTIEPLDTGLES